MNEHYLDAVGADEISDVARGVFGSRTEVLASRLLGVGTGNLAYLVSITGDDRRYVFRFNRGFRDDVYESEAVNYELVADATGVRVPEIIAIDRSMRLVPATYMVLEYLTGRDWTALCSPGNLDTSPQQKHEIRRATGRFYADLHAVTRPAAAQESISGILLGLEQFAPAVQAGYLNVELDRVADCQRVVREDEPVHATMLSLCMGDGEIFFEVQDDSYELAFVCDLEWVGFGNRLGDLSPHVVPGRKLFELDEPVMVSSDDLDRDPFFRSYAESAELDAGALGRTALYTQLSMWGMIAGEAAPAEKKRWIRAQKLPLINELIRVIATL